MATLPLHLPGQEQATNSAPRVHMGAVRVQCWGCSSHSIMPSPTSFLETFSCRDFSCRCCSLLTRIHPCSMSDTVYQEAEAGEQLGPEPPETPHSHS